MYSTEVIRKFPKDPQYPIVFYVYNSDLIEEAEVLIRVIHGEDYLQEHVTVCALDHDIDLNHNFFGGVLTYIDPAALSHRQNGYN